MPLDGRKNNEKIKAAKWRKQHQKNILKSYSNNQK